VVDYTDLFDIEQRPGSGVGLWMSVVERQLERVKEVNYRHRLHLSPVQSERKEDVAAESELHGEVYFLVLAIRRVMLFADALARQIEDARLASALARFDRQAPQAREVRNLFEHVDEYLLDMPGKHMRQIDGRVAPVLISRWDADNVVIAYGGGALTSPSQHWRRSSWVAPRLRHGQRGSRGPRAANNAISHRARRTASRG
jgi:hypothetical protein